MNDSVENAVSENLTVHETFWPCFHWHLDNDFDYDEALALCSYLPGDIVDANKKIGIVSIVVGAVALLMNGVVLSGILRNRHLKKPMYLFVANLAMADCLAGLFSSAIGSLLQWDLLQPLTLVSLVCMFLLVLVLSAVGVVVLSVDRYLAILHPIFYQTRMSAQHVTVSLLITWPVCVVVCLSPVMGWNCIGTKTTENCIILIPVNYLIIVNVVLFMAVAFVVFVNVRICIVLKKRFSRTGPLPNAQDSLSAAQRREQRVAARQHRQLKQSIKKSVTVVIIAALFIVFWLPICVQMVGHLFCHAKGTCEGERKRYWGAVTALCNSVINPVVYAFRIKKVREALQRRARRLTDVVCQRLGRSSNQVMNIRTTANVYGMEAAGPSGRVRTDLTPGRPDDAVRQRLGRSSNQLQVMDVATVGNIRGMEAAGPSRGNRTDQATDKQGVVNKGRNTSNANHLDVLSVASSRPRPNAESPHSTKGPHCKL